MGRQVPATPKKVSKSDKNGIIRPRQTNITCVTKQLFLWWIADSFNPDKLYQAAVQIEVVSNTNMQLLKVLMFSSFYPFFVRATA